MGGPDSTGKPDHVTIKLVPGKVAPRYTEPMIELRAPEMIITEQGMASGKPIVDIHFTDAEGNRYCFITSGSLIRAMAAAVGGVNLRNHGTEDP
jgi:hypothetical protein